METKTIYAVVIYEAQVPEDVDTADLQSILQDKFDCDLEDFRINLTEHTEDGDSEPIFSKHSIEAGEEVQLVFDGSTNILLR